MSSDISAELPAERRYLGWQESLAQFTHLVEPHISNS